MSVPSLYPVRLEGDRVSLREVDTATDAEAAFRFASDPEFFRYLPHEPVSTVEEEEAFLEHVAAGARAEPRRQYNFAVVERDRPEIVGMARLGITDPAHLGGDVGYGLRPDLWGRGYITEAAALLLEFGFGLLGLHRIFAYHHPDNIGSARVLEKVGMQREGLLRENMRAHGVWRDSVVWAILEREWSAFARDVGRPSR